MCNGADLILKGKNIFRANLHDLGLGDDENLNQCIAMHGKSGFRCRNPIVDPNGGPKITFDFLCCMHQKKKSNKFIRYDGTLFRRGRHERLKKYYFRMDGKRDYPKVVVKEPAAKPCSVVGGQGANDETSSRSSLTADEAGSSKDQIDLKAVLAEQSKMMASMAKSLADLQQATILIEDLMNQNKKLTLEADEAKAVNTDLRQEKSNLRQFFRSKLGKGKFEVPISQGDTLWLQIYSSENDETLLFTEACCQTDDVEVRDTSLITDVSKLRKKIARLESEIKAYDGELSEAMTNVRALSAVNARLTDRVEKEEHDLLLLKRLTESNRKLTARSGEQGQKVQIENAQRQRHLQKLTRPRHAVENIRESGKNLKKGEKNFQLPNNVVRLSNFSIFFPRPFHRYSSFRAAKCVQQNSDEEEHACTEHWHHCIDKRSTTRARGACSSHHDKVLGADETQRTRIPVLTLRVKVVVGHIDSAADRRVGCFIVGATSLPGNVFGIESSVAFVARRKRVAVGTWTPMAGLGEKF
jgi:hypothetical protein